MGAVVTDYTIFTNLSDSGWTKIQGYNYASQGYVALIDCTINSILAGKFYSFVYTAKNVVGASDFSNIVVVPIAD